MTLFLLLTACSGHSDFTGPSWDPETGYALYEEGDIYVAVATRTRTRGQKSLFNEHVDVIEASLPAQEGLVMYAFGGRFPGAWAETVSVWHDNEALGEFLAGAPHQDAKVDLELEVQHAIWEFDGADLPVDWEAAQERVDELYQ